MKRLFSLFKNKFFWTTAVFVVWMIFFDKNDLFSQYQYHQELNKLEQERSFYTKQTLEVRKDLDELTSDPVKLEKFAREKYLMKKDNEDIFVIIKDNSSTN
jgi:cell division protein FtsB